MIENVQKFVSQFIQSLQEKTFVKLSLGHYKGADEHLQKILVRLVETKRGTKLFFLYRYTTRDTAKNYDLSEGTEILSELLGKNFFSAHLFTTKNDFQLEIGKKGKSRLNVARPTFTVRPTTSHDREKKHFVQKESFYLKTLGITTDHGEIKDRQQDKWKQINKFVETLGKFFENSLLKDRKELKIVDMGCGKGYLTFATYDYFKNILGLDVKITGVDTKTQIVELCNDIAKTCEFNDLQFVNGWIGDYDLQDVDILIALHACNTATDDAIFKGIQANADLIVVAPCCHQELRPQIKSPDFLEGILRHGVMMERTAETVTDGLRSLLLEKSGYSTKLFEFIATEHTPKNNMLVGTRLEKNDDFEKVSDQIKQIKEFYGIEEQRLESLLNQ
ncbi:MAG: SAM-dependent methyltransferase [Acidobacteriota bacterium]